jgi:hypothetical protein
LGLRNALPIGSARAKPGYSLPEVYVRDDVGGKRIAIAPAALEGQYRKE